MSNCPDSPTLQAFAIGKLGGSEWQSVATHIEGCGDCLGRLDQLDAATDPLVEQLLQLPETPAETGAAESESWASRVLVADAGRDLARRLDGGSVRLDRFEIQAELGVGSFGYVFRAWDPRLERNVALKVQRAGSFVSTEEVQRFLREARSAAPLKHPAIVSLYETGHTEEGVGYLVCEFIDGETLETRLARGPLAPAEATELAAELADALDYAHEHGVIHRDIKPSNIILDRRGHPHLMDFGLAKQDRGEASVTSDGRLLGTPAYMSPEQARGTPSDVDARSDIYSLGVVLYEMLTGRRPFGGDRRQLLLAVMEEDPRPPRELNRNVPRDLEIICLKAMHKSPSGRYATARALADDLARYRQAQPILARPLGFFERALRWCRRYPQAVSVLAAVLVGSVSGLVYLSSLAEYFVQQTALGGARLEAKMLDEVWRFYSQEIEDIKNVPITENYRTVHPSLPLPATFAIDLGERISQRTPGMKVRVYSRYPWPGRKDGGPQDEFDRLALTHLERHSRPSDNPPAEYSQFVAEGGRRKLLFYTARHMEQSCLGCHNHPEGNSPKKDWKLGEVVGVLKIVRPLDDEIESTRRGLRGAFVLMGSVAAALVVLSLAVTIVAQQRRKAAV